MRYINPSEAIKRLAAAQGIDILNLVKTEQQLQQEQENQVQQQQNQELLSQAGQLAGTPLLDPSKNPDAVEQFQGMAANAMNAMQQPPE